MGYFSNGTEGELYEARYCRRCVHGPQSIDDDECPVWLLHLIHNYDECNNKDSFLDALIPRTEDRLFNDQCKMFLPREGEINDK